MNALQTKHFAVIGLGNIGRILPKATIPEKAGEPLIP